MTTKIVTVEERIRAASTREGVAKLYFNGFVLGTGPGDVTAVLEQNDVPVAILNMSYTVAKTFALKLGQSIASFEAITERTMLTTDDVEEKFTANIRNAPK